MSAPLAQEQEDVSVAGCTDFSFEHRIFKLPGARIVMDEARREPVFHVLLGELQVSLSFDVLKREFGLAPGTRDGELLGIAAKGLRYVREIRPFDSIPSELLDGSASWTVEERHIRIARAKLIAQLGAAVTRERDSNFTVERIMSFSEDPMGRREVQAVFAEMAEMLELGPAGKDEVVARIETCAREFAYIEALREAAGQVSETDLKLTRLIRAYHKDRNVREELQRVRNFMRKPITEFANLFLQIEAQTGEMVALLRNMTRQIAYIRSCRDDLHHRLMKWSPLFEAWRDQPIESGRTAETNIRMLYQFLARSYAPKVDWR